MPFPESEAYKAGAARAGKEYTRCDPLPTNPFEPGSDEYRGWEDHWHYNADQDLAADYGWGYCE